MRIGGAPFYTTTPACPCFGSLLLSKHGVARGQRPNRNLHGILGFIRTVGNSIQLWRNFSVGRHRGMILEEVKMSTDSSCTCIGGRMDEDSEPMVVIDPE